MINVTHKEKSYIKKFQNHLSMLWKYNDDNNLFVKSMSASRKSGL